MIIKPNSVSQDDMTGKTENKERKHTSLHNNEKYENDSDGAYTQFLDFFCPLLVEEESEDSLIILKRKEKKNRESKFCQCRAARDIETDVVHEIEISKNSTRPCTPVSCLTGSHEFSETEDYSVTPSMNTTAESISSADVKFLSYKKQFYSYEPIQEEFSDREALQNYLERVKTIRTHMQKSKGDKSSHNSKRNANPSANGHDNSSELLDWINNLFSLLVCQNF